MPDILLSLQGSYQIVWNISDTYFPGQYLIFLDNIFFLFTLPGNNLVQTEFKFEFLPNIAYLTLCTFVGAIVKSFLTHFLFNF